MNFKDSSASLSEILFSPSYSAKSLTLLNNLFATLGVPLLRFATSFEASASMSIPKIPDERVTIFVMSSTAYGSNLKTTPNLSLNGEDRLPALVVAPIKVKCLSGILMLLAIAPVPLTKSNVKSSIAGYKTSSMFLFSL